MTEKSIFVFPGQGTQAIGMGADLAHDFPVARAVFEEVDEALNQNLSQLMFSGDIETLTQTQNAQPAIMAVSMAIFRVLQAEGLVRPVAVAGHSLGEYSALCAAGVLSLKDTARLLYARGMAMAKACQQYQGQMLALLGVTPELAEKLAQQSGCYVANDNAPGQIVLSGLIENITKAQTLSEEQGVKRAILLKVAGAFHSPLMQSAADEMAPLLKGMHFAEPQVPVYFNVIATQDLNPLHYAELLTQQIVAPVRWRELIANVGKESSCFVECGVGAVLSGLIRRILPEADITTIATSEDIKKLFSEI